jgi:hypothetical protein
MVWAVSASLPATPPSPLIPLPFTSIGRGTHGFVPTTVSNITDMFVGQFGYVALLCL